MCACYVVTGSSLDVLGGRDPNQLQIPVQLPPPLQELEVVFPPESKRNKLNVAFVQRRLATQNVGFLAETQHTPFSMGSAKAG
jgi:hypothetical protein